MKQISASNLIYLNFAPNLAQCLCYHWEALQKCAGKCSNMAQGTLFSYFGKVKKVDGQASVNTSSKEWMKPGELVWAKMEGYPYWPAMITNTNHVHHKMLRGSKSDRESHVQFFGDPPTRGWVPVKYAIRH